MARARHEAAWTDEQATVRGRTGGNRGWVMLAVGFAVVAVVTVFAYNRLMNFQPMTFNLYHCDQPLTEDSTWADAQAAGCAPATIDGDVLTMWHGGDQDQADTTTDSSWTFEDVPLKSVVNSMQLDTRAPARSVVLVEPDKENIRRVLTSDAAGTRWSGFIGDRASTTMWVLVTPEAR